MDFFRGAKNWFKGVFSGDDDDERKRRERERQQRQVQPRQARSFDGRPNSFRTVEPPKRPEPIVEKKKEQPQAPVKKETVKKYAPRVREYQNPGVQDVNNYYKNDLDVLNREIAKGDMADPERIKGIMQSLDNRREELRKFHEERGKAKSFQSARALEERIKQTRGDWTDKRKKLEEFWKEVGDNETGDFAAFLSENRGGQTRGARSYDWRRSNKDFTKDETELGELRTKQQIADKAMEAKDMPLDAIGGATIDVYLNRYNSQEANEQQDTVAKLDKLIQDNQSNASGDPRLQKRLQQAYILRTVIEEKGDHKSNFRSKLKTAGRVVSGMGESIYDDVIKRTTQSIDALTGGDEAGKLFEDWKSGKISNEEYNRRISELQRDTEWIPEEGNMKDRILTSIGTGADVAGTIYPGALIFKGARNANRGRAAAQSLKRTAATEGAANAALGAVGSLRDGEVDVDAMLVEAGLGGAIGTAAPYAGAGLSKVFRGARQGDNIVDDVLESSISDRPRNLLPDDIDTPAYQRRLTPEAREARIAADAADVAQEPTIVYRQRVQAVIDEEKGRLDDYIAKNPELTPAQIEAAVQATRDRIIALTDEMAKRRAAVIGAVDSQGEQIAEGAATQAEVAQEVADNRAAASTPSAGEVVEGADAPRDPELTANDSAYSGRTDSEVLFGDAPTFTEPGRRSIPQTLSLDRLFRENISNPLERGVNRVINRAQTSRNPISRFFGRLPTGVSREAGVSEDLMLAKQRMRGQIETGKLTREAIADLGDGLNDVSKNKVWASLDPDRAVEIGIEVPPAEALTPEELTYRTKLKDIIDYTTSENLRRGLITPEQANAGYIKRGYSVFEGDSEFGRAYEQTRSTLLKQFKGRDEVTGDLLEESITDPGYLVAKKSAESHGAWAVVDYANYLDETGITSVTRRPGYMQLPKNKLYGNAQGKWVPQSVMEDFTGFQYNIGMMNSFNDVLNAYDQLGIRRAKKQLLTVFNPAVRLGNRISNLIFANMNGINPVQFGREYILARGYKNSNDQLYREAVEMGLTGIDVTQADFARRLSTYLDDPNAFQKFTRYAQDSYSGADDQARVAAYAVHRKRGLSMEEAARLTQRGFQDYNSVGFMYDLAAKTPLIGNAFVRFAADAMRIAKNAAVDHPLRTAATIAMWTQFTDIMSQISNESEEDRATREGRFGAPKIPFTDISLTVQTPWGEINAARFLPFYALNDVGSEVKRFLPIQGNPLDPQNFNDPLLGQVGQLIADEDFRGKSITDPDNVEFEDGTTKYDYDPLSDDDKMINRLRFLFNNNAPLGREIDAIASATGTEVAGGVIGDEDGEDLYGKNRSLWQALSRALGVKVEEYGSEQAADTRNTEDYFDRKDEIEAEVAGMDAAAQAAYRRLTGQYNLRDQKPNPFEPGETVDKNAPVYDWSEQKYGEYMQNPELFELMEKRANRESQANESPLNPIFDQRLPESFRRQILQLRSIAPGDDLELQQRMYEDPQWDYYQTLMDEYREKASKYYKSDGNDDFVDEMVKHQDSKFPEKPAKWKEYTDARERGEKPEWNDEYEAARTEYENAKLNWTNKERAVRGLPAIPAEQWFNSTFGYDPDADSGFGFGGGGGSSRPYQRNLLGRLFEGGDIRRYDPIEAEAMPDLASLFARLRAGSGGGRRKPPIGASSRGQG